MDVGTFALRDALDAIHAPAELISCNQLLTAMANAKDPNFEYDLDNFTRLLEEQGLKPAQGARPKRKTKMKPCGESSTATSNTSLELELELAKQETLKIQL